MRVTEVVSFLIGKPYVIAKVERLKQSFVYRMPIDEIASYLAMTLTNVGSFLIKKRYVIAKEERLKQSLDLEYPLMRLLRASQGR
jgi:hypothetical protein